MTATISVCQEALTQREHRAVVVPCDGRTIAAAVLEALGVRVDHRAACGPTEHCVAILNGRTLPAGSPEWRRPLLPADRLTVAPAAPGDPIGIIIALIVTVASAAISNLLAPAVASTPDQPEDPRRFSFGRYSRAAVRGDPIPVVFGEHQRYGPVKVVAVAGDGDNGDSVLKLLYVISGCRVEQIGTRAYGSGAADFLNPGTGTGKISGIFLNDQPIEDFTGAKVFVRFGAAGQTAIPGFVDTEIPREVAAGSGGALLANTSGSPHTGGSDVVNAVTYTSVDAVDAVILRVQFPGGLYQVGSNGATAARTVSFRYRWRTYPGGSFGAWTTKTITRSDRQVVTVAPRIDGMSGGGAPTRVEVQVQRVEVDATSAAVADVMRLLEVIEVRYDVNKYAGCALLGLVLTASEQLASEPRVSVKVKGYNALRVWDGISDPESPAYATGYSNDPADILLALLTDADVGLGGQLDDSRVDVASILACRGYNQELVAAPSRGASATRRRFVCNLALLTEQSALDVVRTVAQTMRAVAIFGDVVRVIQARPRDSAVEVFTDGTIQRSEKGDLSLSLTYTDTRGGRAVANQLRGQFSNELLDPPGADDVVVYPDAGDLWLGGEDAEPILSQTVKLEGITDPDQAMAELVYQMTRQRAIDSAVTFTTTVPFVKCQPLERIGVAQSTAGWGVISGRLVGGLAGSSAAALVLDRTLEVGDVGTYSVMVAHLDGSVEHAGLSLAPGEYPAGTALALDTPLGQDPVANGLGAEYSIGLAGAGSELVPMIVQGIRRVDGGGGGGGSSSAAQGGGAAAAGAWEITATPYDARIYDADPGDVVLANYSTLGAERSAPGPVVGLVIRERTLEGNLAAVELAWTQTPRDRQHTASFRVYRRDVGSSYWQLIPGLHAGLAGVDLGVVGSAEDVALEFAVVAVSPLGSCLSVYDPRVPVVALRLGLGLEPPPPPTGLLATQVSGNVYLLTWDAVDAAASYQVLGGGDTGTGLPNDGAEDCLVVARTVATQLQVELAAGESVTFWVRSVASGGRLSWTAASVTIASPAAPAGEVVKDTFEADLSSDGTLTNAAWNGGLGYVEITDATLAGGGVWESDAIDTGAATLTRICVRPGTSNAAEDVPIADLLFGVPSIEADQWGVTSGSGASAVVGMLMPPYPDDQQNWLIEVKTSVDGVSYTDFESLALGGVGGSVQRILRYYIVRVTMTRKTAATPYTPALRGIAVVATN